MLSVSRAFSEAAARSGSALDGLQRVCPRRVHCRPKARLRTWHLAALRSGLVHLQVSGPCSRGRPDFFQREARRSLHAGPTQRSQASHRRKGYILIASPRNPHPYHPINRNNDTAMHAMPPGAAPLVSVEGMLPRTMMRRQPGPSSCTLILSTRTSMPGTFSGKHIAISPKCQPSNRPTTIASTWRTHRPS